MSTIFQSKLNMQFPAFTFGCRPT